MISHERQIDFFVKVDKLSRRMCDGVDVSTGFALRARKCFKTSAGFPFRSRERRSDFSSSMLSLLLLLL